MIADDCFDFCRHTVISVRSTGSSSTITRIVMRVPETGRVQKMKKSARDMISDCRSAVSMIGPSTKASTIGAIGKPNLVIRYPSRPNAVMVTISIGLLFTP